ncbi:hypothetical protein E2C01_099199 [Portunus trituberculatus]|uniref:Uncharacterized protein n=1 Tax=Portunus trituberculatus TaxID=210409 RepID=A0A5B7KET6_PORTR|nr:hypothetical protein [Portunus trituberculatus]
MVLDEAVAISIEAQVDLADTADYDIPLLAAVLAGLAAAVNRGMEEGKVKPLGLIRCVTSVSSDRLGDLNSGAEDWRG